MTPRCRFRRLASAYFNPLTVDPNSPHDEDSFSLILGLENTVASGAGLFRLESEARGIAESRTYHGRRRRFKIDDRRRESRTWPRIDDRFDAPAKARRDRLGVVQGLGVSGQ